MAEKRLWKRFMKVAIEDVGVEYTYPPWGIAFRVKFDITPVSNAAEVHLWNLSRNTIRQLKRGQVVRLYAGYEEDEVGLCFAGVIDQIETKYDKVDKITRLVVVNGKDSVLKNRPNKTWPAGTPCSTVVSDLFEMGGLRAGRIEIKGNAVYDKAISFTPKDTVASALDQVLRDVEEKTGVKHTWYVDLGYGYFVPRDWSGDTGKKLVITPETGLIESPEPLNAITSNVAGVQAEPVQWRVRSVFLWRAAPGSQVEVDCKRFKGLLKVVSGEHICTPTEKFETDLVCDEVSVTLVDYDYWAGDVRTQYPSGAGELVEEGFE